MRLGFRLTAQRGRSTLALLLGGTSLTPTRWSDAGSWQDNQTWKDAA